MFLWSFFWQLKITFLLMYLSTTRLLYHLYILIYYIAEIRGHTTTFHSFDYVFFFVPFPCTQHNISFLFSREFPFFFPPHRFLFIFFFFMLFVKHPSQMLHNKFTFIYYSALSKIEKKNTSFCSWWAHKYISFYVLCIMINTYTHTHFSFLCSQFPLIWE